MKGWQLTPLIPDKQGENVAGRGWGSKVWGQKANKDMGKQTETIPN